MNTSGYFNPATVEAIEAAGGRRLPIRQHSELVAMLGEGERLIILVDRYAFWQACDATATHIHDQYRDLMRREIVNLLGYFALSNEALLNSPKFDWRKSE